MAGGSGFQPRFSRAIAVKNRSHNQKKQIQNYKVSFSIKPAAVQARGGAYFNPVAHRLKISAASAFSAIG
jgi:hypothetical protein